MTTATCTKQVCQCSKFAPIMFCEMSGFGPCLTKVCSLKTSLLSLHWATFWAFWFTQNLHKFTQFALILHRIYTKFTSQPAFFLGKKAGWEMCKPSVNFEQTVQTLSKQTCVYRCKFAQCKLFWPWVLHVCTLSKIKFTPSLLHFCGRLKLGPMALPRAL